MLLRKTSWFWKSGLAAISFVLILSISGCSDAPPEENTVSETVIDVQDIQEESEEDADEIINILLRMVKNEFRQILHPNAVLPLISSEDP